jgi:hypothetical protein
MRDLLPLLLMIVRLVRPGGVRSVIAESGSLEHQFLILNRTRRRADCPAFGSLNRRILFSLLAEIPAAVFPKAKDEAGTERPRRRHHPCRRRNEEAQCELGLPHSE